MNGGWGLPLAPRRRSRLATRGPRPRDVSTFGRRIRASSAEDPEIDRSVPGSALRTGSPLLRRQKRAGTTRTPGGPHPEPPGHEAGRRQTTDSRLGSRSSGPPGIERCVRRKVGHPARDARSSRPRTPRKTRGSHETAPIGSRFAGRRNRSPRREATRPFDVRRVAAPRSRSPGSGLLLRELRRPPCGPRGSRP